MNSVTRHLTSSTLAATLFIMRSGKKSVFLVVEGGSDVDLLSQLFALPHSNLLACGGKNNLMELVSKAPAKGIDAGTIFFRDRDHDGLTHYVQGESLVLFTDRYDIEIELMSDGVFPRIFREYATGNVADQDVETAWDNVLAATAWIGALRKVGIQHSISLDFDDLKLPRFVNSRTMIVDVSAMVSYVCAKSKITGPQINQIKDAVEGVMQSGVPSDLACGKDLLEMLSLSLSRHYRYCDYGQSSPAILRRIIRIKSELATLRKMSFFARMKKHVSDCNFKWEGAAL